MESIQIWYCPFCADIKAQQQLETEEAGEEQEEDDNEEEERLPMNT